MQIPLTFRTLHQLLSATPALVTLGFRPAKPAHASHWVLTTGVDPHVDDHFGPTLLWTLHNDGLQFWQLRGARRTPAVGDVMLFDDRVEHSMDLTRAQKDPRFERAVWVGWAVPLHAI